jgi:hypothetical protein
LRSIISTAEFDREVAALGGARAIDEALSPFIEALMHDPYGFDKFEADGFSFRWLITRETAMTPALLIVFRIEPSDKYSVVLEHIEEMNS